MEQIDLMVSGYEWDCLKCGQLNRRAEVVELVICSECRTEYEVADHIHATG